MKVCTKCKLEKELGEFYSSGVYFQSHCKSCRREAEKQRLRDHSIRINTQRRTRYKIDRDQINQDRRERYATDSEYRTSVISRAIQFHKDHPEVCREKNRRQKKLTSVRLRNNLAKRIWDALCRNAKSAKTMELVGCSIEHLKLWLTFYFQKDMTWKNYGEWHIDHIKPCASFDLADPAQQRECFNYTNLQPLWAGDNLRKGDKYVAV